MIVCAMHEYHDNSGVLKYLRWNENGLLFYFQSISNAQLTYPYMLMKNRGGVERYRERKRERDHAVKSHTSAADNIKYTPLMVMSSISRQFKWKRTIQNYTFCMLHTFIFLLTFSIYYENEYKNTRDSTKNWTYWTVHCVNVRSLQTSIMQCHRYSVVFMLPANFRSVSLPLVLPLAHGWHMCALAIYGRDCMHTRLHRTPYTVCVCVKRSPQNFSSPCIHKFFFWHLWQFNQTRLFCLLLVYFCRVSVGTVPYWTDFGGALNWIVEVKNKKKQYIWYVNTRTPSIQIRQYSRIKLHMCCSYERWPIDYNFAQITQNCFSVKSKESIFHSKNLVCNTS